LHVAVDEDAAVKRGAEIVETQPGAAAEDIRQRRDPRVPRINDPDLAALAGSNHIARTGAGAAVAAAPMVGPEAGDAERGVKRGTPRIARRRADHAFVWVGVAEEAQTQCPGLAEDRPEHAEIVSVGTEHIGVAALDGGHLAAEIIVRLQVQIGARTGGPGIAG